MRQRHLQLVSDLSTRGSAWLLTEHQTVPLYFKNDFASRIIISLYFFLVAGSAGLRQRLSSIPVWLTADS